MAAEEPQPRRLPVDAGLVTLLGKTRAESGHTLLQLLDEKPMLLVFLRHFGCPFTRETVHEIAQVRADLDRRGVRPVFVHMAPPDRARTFFARYGLSGVEQVSNPDTSLYGAPEFHLLKATALPHFFGAKAYWKMATRVLWRFGAGAPGKGEDALQLPGVFFLKDRTIYRAFRHKNLGDRPDYAMFGV